MRRILGKIGIFLSIALVLIFFLFNTNPNQLPLLLLFVPFILVYVLMLLFFHEIARLFLRNLGQHQRRWIVGFIALLPVGLLLTMSAGQTEANDIVLFVIFMALVIFYFSRINFLK
ncbi:MAG: hypothetical protein U5L95_01520 [Candidatus Saccharibacteria bacterium]|nr:hypothetical protein [Candidatus Saccharibacteria bacterium]